MAKGALASSLLGSSVCAMGQKDQSGGQQSVPPNEPVAPSAKLPRLRLGGLERAGAGLERWRVGSTLKSQTFMTYF